MSEARLNDALARLDEHHRLHLPLRRGDILGRLALKFLWRRQLKWQVETNLATRDAIAALAGAAQDRQARADEQLHHELDSLRRSDQNMMAGLNQRLYSAVGRVQTQLSDLRMQLGDRMENNAEIEQRVKAMEEQIAALVAAAQDVRLRHAQLDLFLDELRAARPEKPESTVTETVGDRGHFIESALSELLDGPADQIRRAREAYVPAVSGPVFDMAPARGEWLEVLRAAGIEYQAASTNPLVRKQCAGLGGEVLAGDPLDVLASTPPRSLGSVTAFRYVERLDPAVLARFVDLAAAALRPGGVLLVETPVAGSESFHADPFAHRPVHPAYLGFLAEAAGFARTEVREVPTLPLNLKAAPLTGQTTASDRYCLIATR